MTLRYFFSVPMPTARAAVKPALVLECVDFLDCISTVMAIEMSVWTAKDVRVCVYEDDGQLFCRCTIYRAKSRLFVGSFEHTLGTLLCMQYNSICRIDRTAFHSRCIKSSAKVLLSWLEATGDFVF